MNNLNEEISFSTGPKTPINTRTHRSKHATNYHTMSTRGA